MVGEANKEDKGNNDQGQPKDQFLRISGLMESPAGKQIK